MHRGVVAEDFGADDDVLGEIFRDAATDHENAGGGVFDFELRQFVEVLGAVHGHVRLVAASMLMRDHAEAGRAVAEGRAEDGDIALPGFVHDGVGALRAAIFIEIPAHFRDELAA